MKRKRRYENVSSFTDRHGKLRWRWRKTGFPAYYFRNPPDSAGFSEEYEACKQGAPIEAGGGRAIPRSIADLCSRYYRSKNFNKGGEADQHRRRLIIESFRKNFPDDLVANFRWDHIEAILIKRSKKTLNDKGRLVGGPAAERNLRKQLARLFAFAVKLEWITANPVSEVETEAPAKGSGYYSWTEDDIAQFQAHHVLGTRARLALEIMLWTGARRSDARLFGPDHLKGGFYSFKVGKTGREQWAPAAPQLLQAVGAMGRIGLKTYLVTEAGKPFSKAGFGNKVREWCDEAGLPQCTAHGLRKAMARRLAEAGESQQAIKAAGGWKGDAEVSTYTAAADQKRLASGALGRLAASHLANHEQEVSQYNDTND